MAMLAGIKTRRRLEYASGFLELGLIAEARAEIAAISEPDQRSLDVRRLRVRLHMEAKEWSLLIELAPSVCAEAPGDADAWIYWAYALRELQRVEEAQSVLLQAEPLHGESCAVLQYNLACYASLLGDLTEAKRRLEIACRSSEEWRVAARTDPDLKALLAEIAPDE